MLRAGDEAPGVYWSKRCLRTWGGWHHCWQKQEVHPATVFRFEWPEWVKEEVRKINSGRGGTLTNSDLEMAGLLLLWLIMGDVSRMEPGDHSAVFSDNSPDGEVGAAACV